MSFGSLALSLGFGNCGPSVTPALGPGIVTAVEFMGDTTQPVTSPASVSVAMPTNGILMRVATSGSAAYSALDLTKISLAVADQGWDTAGNQVTRHRTIKCQAHMHWAYNQTGADSVAMGVYQPNAGEFYIVLANRVFNQDATWKTTITSVDFAAGWLTGQPAGQVGSVTRSDSLAYPPGMLNDVSPPYTRVVPGTAHHAEFLAVSPFAQNLSQMACVEAWLVDSAGTAGTVSRASSMALSTYTPSSGATVPGNPVPTYQVDIDATGLAAGRAERRCVAKPWIGPSWANFTNGDTWPTANPAKGVPVGIDTDGSHAPIYGVLSNENASAPSGKTLITSTTDFSGLSLSIAGAVASNKVYSNSLVLALAITNFNKSATNVTTADGSIKRATLHNDSSGGVALCPPVTGSVLGANAGAYSLWQSMDAVVPGITAFEIRSVAGTPSNDVRWRGVHSDNTVLAITSKFLSPRIRLRGLTLDSTGAGLNVNFLDNVCFRGNNTATSLTEAQAFYAERVDCKILGTDAVDPSGNGVHQNCGYVWDFRIDLQEPRGADSISPGNFYNCGVVRSVGCSYAQNKANNHSTVEFIGLAGTKLHNVISGAPSVVNRPNQKGRIFFNVESAFDTNNMGSNACWNVGGANYPIVNGEGYVNTLIYGNDTGMTGPSRLSEGGEVCYVDGLVIFGFNSAWPVAASGAGRINIAYNDCGYVSSHKQVFANYIVTQSWNNKGDWFVCPSSGATVSVNTETSATTTRAYYAGQMVTNTTNATTYQALVNTTSGDLLTNAAKFAVGGASATATGQQSRRQGNLAFRFQVDNTGHVVDIDGFGDAGAGPGSEYGMAWSAGSKLKQAWGTGGVNYFNAPGSYDFTPKAAGPLVNMVPAGMAYSPIDLHGYTMLNDGTDAAGPLQIPH